jgi:hypothetical protein
MPTYAERLAEFVKVTGHRPGEMNRVRPDPLAAHDDRAQLGQLGEGHGHVEALERFPLDDVGHAINGVKNVVEGSSTVLHDGNVVAGASGGKAESTDACALLTRAVALGDNVPCKLASGHEGACEL